MRHRTNSDPIHPGFDDALGALFVNLLVGLDNHLSRQRIANVFRLPGDLRMRSSSGWIISPPSTKGRHDDAVGGAAILLGDDHILADVDQPTSQIS